MIFESYGRFDIGELIKLSAFSDVNSTYTFTVYSLLQGKYLNNTGAFVASSYSFSATKVSLGNSTYSYNFQINTTTFTQAEKLIVTIINSDLSIETRLFVNVGKTFASTPTKITAYGTVYDAYGSPIKGESVSFTVLNSATYFDNSPTTAISAYTQTDNSGYFSIDLNRRYDYVLSISRVNYTKVVKFSTVPSNISVVEIAVGTGSGC